MDLIQTTIDPDAWEDAGGSSRMNPFPSGVFVDGRGTLKKIETSQSAALDLRGQAIQGLPEGSSLNAESSLRKISLTRLEKNLESLIAQGKPIPEDLFHLGGIYELKYLIIYPDTKDIVIAGPAGEWHWDETGRAIHTASGKPVLRLDDMVICLRNAWNQNGQFGCSIDPTAENLQAVQDFMAERPAAGRRWAEDLRDTLGMQKVTVNGIDGGSHAARVIVEADYHMKLVAMGLEPSVPSVSNFMSRLQVDESGNAPSLDLVRWWFTMDYASIQANESRTIFELQGPGVKLLSEKEFLDDQGQRVNTGESTPHAKAFARDFTTHFQEMAAKYPVYAEMKNIFDCALVANLIHEQNAAQKIGWIPGFFAEPQPSRSRADSSLTFVIPDAPVPVQVATVLGSRQFVQRQGTRELTTTIYSVSGGVECATREFVRTGNLQTSLNPANQADMPAPPESTEWKQFWWD